MEYQALYRQFRPANFDEIVEQKAAVATLRKTVLTGKIGHAYLFCGQRGTGKTSIARVFARAINCENPVNGNPCNECAVCKGILDGSLMDVIEIDAASNRSIDNIRSICEEVSYAPSRAKYKVYIIDEVHMITTEAFNALLKTLEEPPAHAVFLFATTEPHQIPQTILSRCQRFDFRRISLEAIKGRLRYICDKENINASEDALELIASMSDGAMRDAISFLDQAAAMASGEQITPESIEEMTGTVNIDFIADFATILIEGSFDKLPVKCKELADSGRDFIQFTLDLAEYFRNLLIVRVVPDPIKLIPASSKSLKRMYEVANLTNSQTLTGFIASFSKIVSDLKWSPSVRTSFEIAMLRLCGRKIKMDEAPLVIPDFSKLQAEAAKKISEGKIETPASAPAPVAASAPEPEAKPVPAIAKGSPFAKKAEEVKKEEPKKEETKPEEVKEEEPEADKKPGILGSLDKLEELKAKTADLLGKKPEEEKKEPELPPIAMAPEEPELDEEELEEPEQHEEQAAPEMPVPPIASAPVEEEIPDEDKPLDNQIGLFFNEDDTSDTPKVGIFANLSDSVLDDISMEDLEEEEEEVYEQESIAFGDEDPDLQAPTGRIGETKRSALSTAVDKSPIVKSRNQQPEEDPRQIWLEIKSRIYEQDRHLGQILASSRLALLGNGAYIIIGSDSSDEARSLGAEQGFKNVSSQLKHRLPGISQVYSCTQRQYDNVQKKFASENPGQEVQGVVFADDSNDRAADFINSLGEAGLNTEIHFGDD
ncbi:MAG: DNA polymerase III subunit gamma/tau [Clostridiales bacterium]|nr:DNA polymerase III subunit gamma/tau [Clostridiales bacterium]